MDILRILEAGIQLDGKVLAYECSRFYPQYQEKKKKKYLNPTVQLGL